MRWRRPPRLTRRLAAILAVFAVTAGLSLASRNHDAIRRRVAAWNAAMVAGLEGLEPTAVARDFFGHVFEVGGPRPGLADPNFRFAPRRGIGGIIARVPTGFYLAARNALGRGAAQAVMTGLSLLVGAWVLAGAFSLGDDPRGGSGGGCNVALFFALLLPLAASVCAWLLLHAVLTLSWALDGLLDDATFPVLLAIAAGPASWLWDAVRKVEDVPDPVQSLADRISGKPEP